MPPTKISEIISAFFIFGSLDQPGSSEIYSRVQAYGESIQIRRAGKQGVYFFTAPAYADIEEDDAMLWIKLGLVHDTHRRYATRELIDNGWLSQEGTALEQLRGSYTLIGFSKKEARTLVYRSLLSPASLRYWSAQGSLLVSDNLRLIGHFLPERNPDPQVEVQHHIYRQVFGRRTYLQGVNNLLGGELLTYLGGEFDISLKRRLDNYNPQGTQKLIDPETVAWFFDQLCAVVGFRLQGFEHQSGTLLSGGVDSSTMQAAINTQPGVDFPFPTFSFFVDTPGFEFEHEYARQAVQLLGTRHTFLKVEPEKFADWLVTSISILGQPVHFDAPPSYYAIAEYISRHQPEIRYLFNGANADVLTGNARSQILVQGDKYRNWPVWLLNLAALLLEPFSQSKSFGARSAAETLASLQDEDDPQNIFNRSSTTNWDLVEACFPPEAIREASRVNRQILSDYSSSQVLVEKRQLLSLLLDGMNTPTLERQLGLFCRREMLFPFSDDLLLEAVLSFEPIDRYSHDHRVKPLMRMALEAQIPSPVTQKPKGNSSVFEQAITPWMREGSLRDLVQDIERPGYLSQARFQQALDEPGWFTWNMLTLDLARKYGQNNTNHD